MIYQQQTAVADAPAMITEAITAPGLSSSFSCCAAAAATEDGVADAVAEATVAASSGF